MDPTEIVDAMQAAYRDRDLERFLAVCAPDVEVRDAKGELLMDRSGMRDFYERLFRNSPELTLEIRNRIAVGDVVVEEEEVRGSHLSGFPERVHAAVAIHLTDTKVARIVFLSVVDLDA